MEQLLSTFHIDVSLIAAQAINFVIVFFALYHFAIKPLIKLTTRRSEVIEGGLKDAELATVKLADAEHEQARIMREASNQANTVLVHAHDQASKEREALLEQARTERQGIVEKAKDLIDQEQAKAEKEFRTQSAQVVVASMESLFRGYVAEGKGDALIKDITKRPL